MLDFPGELRVMVQFIFFLFLLLNWVLLGMVMKKVGSAVSFPPLRVMAGPVQHFRFAILDAWHFHVFAKLSERSKGSFLSEIKCC